MIHVHFKHVIATLEEASVASNAVERGPVPMMLGSAPRRSNPSLNGANPEVRRCLWTIWTI